MDYTVFEVNEINEIKKLDFSNGIPFRIKYSSKYFEYNLLIKINPSYNQLVILSNGAVNHKKKTPPVFMRESWINDIDANLIFIDDGTIHNTNFSLGWGQGNIEEFVLEKYNEIIMIIKDEMDLKDKDISYFGSSAGGFMSLILSAMHPSSNVVTNNPQTIIENYYEAFSKPLLEKIYGSENLELYKHRTNAVEAFKYYNYTPNIYYIQNRLCSHDVSQHVNPFISKMRENDFSMESIVFIDYYDEENGHSPVSNQATLNYLNLLIKENIF